MAKRAGGCRQRELRRSLTAGKRRNPETLDLEEAVGDLSQCVQDAPSLRKRSRGTPQRTTLLPFAPGTLLSPTDQAQQDLGTVQRKISGPAVGAGHYTPTQLFAILGNLQATQPRLIPTAVEYIYSRGWTPHRTRNGLNRVVHKCLVAGEPPPGRWGAGRPATVPNNVIEEYSQADAVPLRQCG